MNCYYSIFTNLRSYISDDYFLTKTANTVLKTRKLFSSAYTYCLELLVGLCTECQLEIFGNMYSTRRFQRVGNISGSGSNQGNLPLWQIARIISPSPYSRIKLVSKRKRKFVSGFWAVKTFRRCKSLSGEHGNEQVDHFGIIHHYSSDKR